MRWADDLAVLTFGTDAPLPQPPSAAKQRAERTQQPVPGRIHRVMAASRSSEQVISKFEAKAESGPVLLARRRRLLEGELFGPVPPPNEEGHGRPQVNWVHSQRLFCTL